MNQDPQGWVPHRPPFLFLEQVHRVDREAAEASYTVGDDGLWELALVEGLAQTAAALRAGQAAPPDRPGMLVGLRRIELLARPAPGERVRYRVKLVKDLPPLTLVEGEARVETTGALLCRGELKFSS